MSSGMSLTDIAMKVSLDYSSVMHGMKVIESRAVDMAKFIATPLYPEKPADAYSAHIRDAMINAKNEYEIAALRQRIIEKEQGERDRDFILFKEDLKRREDEANEHYRRMERDNKVNAERMASFRQKQTETMFANIKFPDNLNSDANYQGLKRQLEAEQEYANAEERRQEEREKRRQRAIELDKKAYEEGKRIQRQAGTDYVIRRNNDKKVDEQVTAAQKQAAEELTSLLDKQKAKNDEIYAQHLRDRKARSEMAAALKAGREAGISNDVLKAMADEFRMQQEIEKRNRLQEDDNDLKLRAERILRSMMTAQDLHNERVKEYTMLLGKGKFTQEQFNAAVKESERIMKTSGKGAGAYTGMLAQASFAAEDFIQGIAMGDLRAALLGASNNLTMVARGALEAAEDMTILGMSAKTFAAYALAIPAAVGGLVAYTSWLNRAVKDTRDLSTVLRDTARGFELVEQSMSFRQQAGRERQRIGEIEDITQAQRELKKATTDQAEAEERLAKARAKRSREGTDILISTLGGQDAYIELQNLIHDLGESEHQASIALGKAMEQSLAGAFGAAQAGEAEKMINYLREINNLSNSMIMKNAKPGGLFENLNILLNDITAQDSLEAVFNTGFLQQTEDQERLREIREKMLQISLDIAKAENDVKQATTNKADSERRILELKQDQIRLQNEALKEEQRIAEQQRLQRQAEMQGEADMLEEKRKQQVFDLQATENQKEMLRIQQQMREFMGPTGTVQPLAMSSITGPLAAALMMGQMQQEAQAAGVQFLEAQAANLEKEIAALQQSSSPEVIGGMQQDAFQAQADAFKQIFAAENKQPNPQLTRQIQLLTDIRAAMAAGGTIKVVGQ